MKTTLTLLLFLSSLLFSHNLYSQNNYWSSETVRNNISGAWTRSADFDNDNDPDILVQAGDSIYWYENLRPGWTAHLIDPTFTNSVYGYVDVMDIDGDGDTDVLKVNTNGNGLDELSWNENQSDGTSWVKHTILFPHTAVLWLQDALGDLDGDGDFDLAVVESDIINPVSQASLYWMEQTDDPDEWIRHELGTGNYGFASVADMDEDQDLDIVASASEVFWLENKLPDDSTWTKHIIKYANPNVYFIGTAADMNGDSLPDIVAGPSINSGAFTWFENPGWEEQAILPVTGFYYLGPVRDIDNDNDLDILFGGNGYVSQPLGWAENQDDGTTWAIHNITAPTSLQQIPTGVDDVDGDGDMDLVSLTFMVSSGKGSALWFANPAISTGVRPETGVQVSFSAWPNPAGDQVTISCQDHQALLLVSVYDGNGRKVLEQVTENGSSLDLDLRGISPGYYTVRALTNKGAGMVRLLRM